MILLACRIHLRYVQNTYNGPPRADNIEVSVCALSLSLVSLQSPHLDLEKRRRRSGVKATASWCSDCSPLGSETAPPFRLQGSSVAVAEGRRAGDGKTTRAAVVLFCARKTARWRACGCARRGRPGTRILRVIFSFFFCNQLRICSSSSSVVEA
jgi:hypothetical protein